MTSSFRTAGPWGGGLGRPLTWAEQDNNTYDKETRLTAIEAAGVAVGIDFIEVVGTNQMLIHMTDSSLQGPFLLPGAEIWNPQGYWQPLSVYQAGDTVQYAGSLYLVLVDHNSSATFDPEEMEGTVPRYHKIADFAPTQGFERTGATFVPELIDANTYNRLTNPSGCAVMIDPSVTFAPWTELMFRDCSSDTDAFCTFEVTTPGGINPVRNHLNQTDGFGATCTLKKVGDTDMWDIFGRLAHE